MSRLAIFFGLIIAVLGLLGVAAPTILLQSASFTLTQIGLYGAAAFRVIVGLVLILAAPTSRMPRTLRVLGGLIVIGGIATPFIGVERARAMVEWWSALGPVFMRVWAALAVLLGSFIIYAASPRR
jgi:hypothetical protein